MWENFKTRKLEGRLKMLKHGTGGLHSTIRNTLLSSRTMGLFPLSGLSHYSSSQLRFTLRSLYTIYYLVSLFGQCTMFCMSFYWLLKRGITLTSFTNSLFYISSLTSSMILVNIGRHWPKLIMQVEELEAELPPFSRNVVKHCNVTMYCVLLAAMVEHLLSMNYGIKVAYFCSNNNVSETYFRYGTPWIFDFTSYTLWKVITSEIFNLQSTFIWTFNDVLIMVISIYLTEHFIVHNKLLASAVEQAHFSAATFRLQHLKIVRLVKIINGQVGIFILTSFGSNLYWICMQLFNSLNRGQTGYFVACQDKSKNYEALRGLQHTVYFTYSFSFLTMRTLMVLLLAARIHSNSKAPLVVLYSLPSEKFSIEAERYIAQINNIKVALSGLDFFYVTRTMILTLLGTIITYELVLLQFN